MISIVSLAKFSIPFSPITDLSVHLITIEVSAQVWQCPEIWMCFLYHSNMVFFQGFKQRREEKTGALLKIQGDPGASILQSSKETDSEGSHARRNSARPGTCCVPRSKAQLFSCSQQCRCCLFLLKSLWLPPVTANALLLCRSGGSCWTPTALQEKDAFLKPGRFGAVEDQNVTLQCSATCCAPPRTSYFCSWVIMELDWKSP